MSLSYLVMLGVMAYRKRDNRRDLNPRLNDQRAMVRWKRLKIAKIQNQIRGEPWAI